MKTKTPHLHDEAGIKTAINQCLSGNNEAFAGIVGFFQARVYHICFHFIGTAQDAEDAASEVFIKAFHSLNSYNPEYKFSTYLYKITVNHCIGILRKKKSEQNYLASQQIGMKEQADANVDTPAALFFKELEQEEVRQMLHSLPLKYRAALMLRYYRDLPYREIAEILDVPRNTAASLILRGKKELRKKLLDYKKSEVQNGEQ